MKKLPELLAPVGSPEALSAAIEAGADAVYLGAHALNARIGAVNFDMDGLAAAINRCHRFGVRAYVTLNTLILDRECEELLATAADLFRMGVDAVIVADLGAIRLLRRHLPDLEIHASTQASIHSTDGAREMAKLGVTRAVLARELSLPDICSVTTHAPLETEIFLHGALCVSYSGQCLFSSLVGGRSGNRGECAQPCRLPYSGSYPLSLRDLSLADHIPALIESGVSSLKIEGRMKSAAYVHGVTSIYRRLLDEGRAATAAENAQLAALFSRSGFTDAYLRGRSCEPMTGVRSDADKEKSRTLPPPPPLTRKIPLSGTLSVKKDEPATLTLTTPTGRTATVTGEIPRAALTAPLTADALASRIARLGGTDYTLTPADLSLTLDGGLNLSPAAVNALRREAVAVLDAPVCRELPSEPVYRYAPAAPCAEGKEAPHAGEADKKGAHGEKRPLRTALCYSPAQADALRKEGFFDRIYLPLAVFDRGEALPDGVYLPPFVYDSEREGVLALLDRAAAAGIRYALCGGIGMLAPLRERGFSVMGDFRLNITNRESAAAIREMGLCEYILSPELSLRRIRDIGGGAIVYGRIPLMLTARCFTKENFGCAQCGHAALTDRRGVRFPLLREYPHRTLICNSRPTYMGDRRDLLLAAGITHEHFLFTDETQKAAVEALFRYREGLAPLGDCRRISKD